MWLKIAKIKWQASVCIMVFFSGNTLAAYRSCKEIHNVKQNMLTRICFKKAKSWSLSRTAKSALIRHPTHSSCDVNFDDPFRQALELA